MNKNILIREQLGKTLEPFQELSMRKPPRKGWIRGIRDALGMSAHQLARRLGVSQQSVARIERDELAGSVSIKTMRKIAEELDCVFIYGFAPKTSLDETVRKRARTVAKKQLGRVSHTMALEVQSLSKEENDRILEDLTNELIQTSSSALWNEE